MLLTKTFNFDAAHRLYDYEGKCKNLHGHTWKVKVTIHINNIPKIYSSKFEGMILDFTEIKNIGEVFDHKNINDVITLNPTAENLTAIINLIIVDKLYCRLKKFIPANTFNCYIVSVRLWESENSYIEMNNTDALFWLGLTEERLMDYKKLFK